MCPTLRCRTRSLRRLVAARRDPALRTFTPGPAVAFGRLDSLRPDFPAACEVARDLGFVPAVRTTGGHAAAYDQDSVIVEHFVPAQGFGTDLQARFDAAARPVLTALRELGADARLGALDGEYCPGAYSINLAGEKKVAGIAQRVLTNAAMTSAVIVVGHSAEIRAVIEAVYAALDIRHRSTNGGRC